MLTKSPELPYNCAQPLAYTSAARVAFQCILDHLDFSADKKLLLPAYIGITEREGSGVLDPVENTQTPYEFYALDLKLSAIKESLYALISSGKFRALLIIHYFGFCQNDMQEIVCLCKKHKVLLIEDCAHTMLSHVSLGQLGHLGDFSFYSIHKFLASDEGGCLQVNNTEYQYLLDKLPSSPAKLETLERVARTDLVAIREKRRANYLYLLELTADIPAIEVMYSELPEGIAPHNFPFLVKQGRREEVYFKLIDRGIPVIALYYRMIDQIKNEGYKNALYISENILNLPIHQDIELKDLLLFKKKLLKAYE